MNRVRQLLVAGLACAAIILAGAAPVHATSTRNYLTVEGSVLDRLGGPLPKAWVFCIGSRRASTPVDSLGKYHLEIPGATLDELSVTSLKIRVQARCKGYRFAFSDRTPELGLEMSVVKDNASSLSRLRVRSNDPEAVTAVANSVVLDANPRALLTAQFIGSPGAQYDSPAVPLEESDEITLAGTRPSIPELAGAPDPATADSAAGGESALAAFPHTVVAPLPGAGSAESLLVAKPLSPPGAPSGTPSSAAPPSASVIPEDPKPRKWNAAGGDRRVERPRVVRPGLDPNPASEPPVKRSRKRPEPPGISISVTDAPAAGSPPAAAAPPSTSASALPADSGAAQTAPSASPSSPTRVTPDPGLRPVFPKDAPVERVPMGPQPPIQTVHPAPGMPVPGTALVPGSGAHSATPICDCYIRGTVEVQSDRPLTSRTEVVVSVEDAPDISTSVELFMGSPRAFEIHPAPCGVHRLRLWTRSRQRFVLVSAEPRVVCTPGGVQQLRLMLEPVARWGASQ